MKLSLRTKTLNCLPPNCTMKLFQSDEKHNLHELGKIGNVADLAYSFVLDGLIGSVPEESKLVFVDCSSGQTEDLFVVGSDEWRPKGLVFSGSEETLYVDIGHTFYGVRIRSLVEFDALGERGKAKLAKERRNAGTAPVTKMTFLQNGFLIAVPESNTVIHIGTNSLIRRVIGSGKTGFGLANTPEQQIFNHPYGVAYAYSFDTLFISDRGNGSIRKFRSDYSYTGVIGTPSKKGCEDGEIKKAKLSSPSEIVCAFGDSIVFVDEENKIRRMNLLTDTISTLATSKTKIAAISGTPTRLFWGETEV